MASATITYLPPYLTFHKGLQLVFVGLFEMIMSRRRGIITTIVGNFFFILRLARFFMKFESKIAAFLDTHLLFAWDAETKQLIGCNCFMETVGNTGLR